MNLRDTITAIATAPGEGGIAVVRISGPDTFAIADRIFRCRAKKPSGRPAGTFVVGHIVDGEEVIDQTLLLIMRAPHSYTTEDTVEIQGHGGHQCARRILRSALDAGARLAEPGEFTQRAFLNGRIDLVQAEAVLDLIHARSERAAAAALDQIEGRLSNQFNALYDDILLIAADIEATLDFPEDELPEQVIPELAARSRAAIERMHALIASWDEGHLLRDGALVVISGKPNVGKSTLLNALLGSERAIVSSTPGTTRDTIEEDLVISGIPIRLIDTAGLRDSDCEIEQIGVQRTRSRMEKADLHIYMLDATQPLDDRDREIINALPANRRLIIANKCDLTQLSSNFDNSWNIIETVMTQNVYAEIVKDNIRRILADRMDIEARPHATISERHRNLLTVARDELQATLDMLEAGTDDLVALASSRIRTALENIGFVTGRSYQEELLNNIFSRFCIGK